MPVIVIASPKGGAGRSTTVVLLGTELAHAGAPVAKLDCAPKPHVILNACCAAAFHKTGVKVCCPDVVA